MPPPKIKIGSWARYKEREVVAAASSSFEEHPAGLASDGSLHSEWWDGQGVHVGALDEWVRLRLPEHRRAFSVGWCFPGK